jgi:hypothetical protein
MVGDSLNESLDPKLKGRRLKRRLPSFVRKKAAS